MNKRHLLLLRRCVVSVLIAFVVGLAAGPSPGGMPRLAFIPLCLAVAVALTYVYDRWQDKRRGAEPGEPHTDVGQLAAAVRQRWDEEAAVQGLKRHPPIAMSWRPGRKSNRVRLSGDFDAATRQLARQFHDLDRKQVVITGPAGAGKTVLAMLLTLGLIDQRGAEDPVPVLVSVADWIPGTHEHGDHLQTWLARQLTNDYGLSKSVAEELVTRRQVFPVLDGLDEMPAAHQKAAVREISRTASRVVITCRTEQFQKLIARKAGLPRATEVRLEAISVDDIAEYLRRADTEGRWEPVIAELTARPKGALASVLSTPLMVWLAMTVYADPDIDPSELTDSRRFSTVAALRDHLLAQYLPSVYNRPQAPPGIRKYARVRATDAQHWLTFLAMRLRSSDTADLRWWLLYRTAGPIWMRLSNLLIGIGVGTALARTDPVLGGYVAGWGLLASLTLILAFGIPFRNDPRWINRSVKLQLGRVFRRAFSLIWLASILLLCFLTGVLVAFSDIDLRVVSADNRPATGVAAAAIAAGAMLFSAAVTAYTHFMQGFTTSVAVSSPRGVLRADRAAVLLRWGMTVALAAVIGLIFWTLLRLGADMAVAGVKFVLFLGLVTSAGTWTQFQIARVILAARGKLPLRLMSFLDDAHRRGVLRQSGSAYQFRHALLRDHLADQR